MSFFDSINKLFGGGYDPAKEANNYYDKIPGQTQPYYQPYIDQGHQAGQDLTGRYNDSLNNPGGVYDNIAKGYKESPGYQQRLQESLRGITNAQAAGGMAGSLQHQQYGAEKAVDMSSKDFEDYLNHVFGIYNQGIQGEQGRETRGYDASKGYADILGNNTANKGAAAYNSAAGKNANASQNFGNTVKFASMFAPGIGAATGGLNLLQPRSYG